MHKNVVASSVNRNVYDLEELVEELSEEEMFGIRGGHGRDLGLRLWSELGKERKPPHEIIVGSGGGVYL